MVLHHGANQPDDSDSPATSARNSRIGLAFFLVYCLIYGGFVALAAFWPSLMKNVQLAGVNLAIVYGLGLIVVALTMALIYLWLCRNPAESQQETKS